MDTFNENRIAAYFLWSYTHCPNALHLWLCAEDMAAFLGEHGIVDSARIEEFLRLGTADREYVGFVRHVAFRVHVFTGEQDMESNWYAAERLLRNVEWREAITHMARAARHKY